MKHDQRCELRLLRIVGYGCRCASRAWAADPIGDDDLIPPVVKVRPGASPMDWWEFRDVFQPLIEATRRCVEAFSEITSTLSTPPAEPTGVRERALWLRQHRNTGPEYGPSWRKRPAG